MFDTIAVIVGLVIGAGIFQLPSLVAAQFYSALPIVTVWFLGGICSAIGALCFAELATTYPGAGGEYHFLSRAFGRNCGFMFAWARMSVIQTGSIALLAYILGDYASELWPLGRHDTAFYAASAIVALTALNIAGVRQTKSLQNMLFAATLLGLLCIIATGAFILPAEVPALPVDAFPETDGLAAALGLAMVFVLLTYGGWNEAAYISAEVQDGPRNIVRALMIGIAVITLFYVAVNLVYVRVLGPSGMAESSAIARDVMAAAVGPVGATFISVLVCLVVLASLNVTILTGARTNFALGRDFALFGFLSGWSEKGSTPVPALLFQGLIALALVTFGAMQRDGLEAMVEYLSPVFWLFFLLTGLSLFVLRGRDPDRARPYRVPLYPLIPALFCLQCAYLLYSSLKYTGTGALVGVGVLLLGLPLLLAARRAAPGPAFGSD